MLNLRHARRGLPAGLRAGCVTSSWSESSSSSLAVTKKNCSAGTDNLPLVDRAAITMTLTVLASSLVPAHAMRGRPPALAVRPDPVAT